MTVFYLTCWWASINFELTTLAEARRRTAPLYGKRPTFRLRRFLARRDDDVHHAAFETGTALDFT